MATTKLTFTPNKSLENERAGLTVMGLSYATIALQSKKDGVYLVLLVCKAADKNNIENETSISKIEQSVIYLRAQVTAGAKCIFSYSLDGKNFLIVPGEFSAEPGRWIGAKVGIYCTRQNTINDSGYADFDWFRIEPVQ
jgi:hypothetical protein